MCIRDRYNLVEGICIGAALLEPFMPATSGKILSQLNAPVRNFDVLDTFGTYPSGTKVIEKPEILFARLDLKEVMEKVEAMQEANAAPQEEKPEEPGIDIEPKEEITYDEMCIRDRYRRA